MGNYLLVAKDVVFIGIFVFNFTLKVDSRSNLRELRNILLAKIPYTGIL